MFQSSYGIVIETRKKERYSDLDNLILGEIRFIRISKLRERLRRGVILPTQPIFIYSSYCVGSSMPASLNASLRSTQVPHLPQCISPPL